MPPRADVVFEEDAFKAAGAPQQRKLRELAKRLHQEPFLGDRIRQETFPKALRHLPNLFRLELPQGWRALYTVLTDRPDKFLVRILWIGDHGQYDRLFGYKRS